MKKIVLIIASFAALMSCSKESSKNIFAGANPEKVLSKITSQPCGIPEKKQTCEFDKNAIDLGGSVYWSSKLLGAAEIGDFGDYYQWGSLEPGKKSMKEWVFYDASAEHHVNAEYLSFDVLPEKYDAAAQTIGHGWRMPTQDEFRELQAVAHYKSVTYNGNSAGLCWTDKGAIVIPGCEGTDNNNAYLWTVNKPALSSNYTAIQFYFLGNDYMNSGNTYGYQNNSFILPVKSK